jgi:hypothetical protein
METHWVHPVYDFKESGHGVLYGVVLRTRVSNGWQDTENAFTVPKARNAAVSSEFQI